MRRQVKRRIIHRPAIHFPQPPRAAPPAPGSALILQDIRSVRADEELIERAVVMGAHDDEIRLQVVAEADYFPDIRLLELLRRDGDAGIGQRIAQAEELLMVLLDAPFRGWLQERWARAMPNSTTAGRPARRWTRMSRAP